MEDLNPFLVYAAAFAKTYEDDDWARLRQYFNEDVVYEVRGLGIDCHSHGPAAIFVGIKKPLDPRYV